jgi:two-component SAPR family response regulator
MSICFESAGYVIWKMCCSVWRLPGNIILAFILCFGSVSLLSAQKVRYGLAFSSFEVIQEKRTGLNLTPNKALSLPDGFTLSFDVCFQSGYQRDFGYVFRIISGEGELQQYIDFVLSITELTVSCSTGEIAAKCNFEDIHLGYDEFMPFEIDIDIRHSRLNVLIKDRKSSINVSSLEKFAYAHIVFGKSDFQQHQVSDVPKMIVKDIRIKNPGGRLLYFWPLSQHTSGGVYDEVKREYASVENPQWLLDRYAFWEKQTSFVMHYNPQVTYNTDMGCIAVADRERFVTYFPATHRLTDDKVLRGVSHSDKSNQIIYNPFLKHYYSYRFSLGEGKEVIPYDTMAKNWDNEQTEAMSVDYWHHNRFFSSVDSCLYLFNGYGHHIYKSTVNKYDFNMRTWEKSDYRGDRITPRYLSGLGAVDEHRVLIFGGYGSESGAQELSSQNYYDLYMIDTKNMKSEKLWEFSPPDTGFVVSNSLIVDTVARCFYALCFPRQLYNTALSLYRFSIDHPGYEVLADNIPFKFEDIYSYCDIYLDKKRRELIAVTFSPVEPDVSTEVSIYTLAYPPLARTSLYQQEDRGSNYSTRVGILIVVALLIMYVFVVYIRRKRGKNESSPIETVDEAAVNIKPLFRHAKKQAVYLFGGFQTFDREGCDITGDFSALLKQLFLLILLYTLKDGKGISSAKLHEILWGNKTENSAKNNRNVSVSRLRQIFEKIGVVRIKNLNSLWTVEFDDNVYCDYYDALILMESMKEGANRTGQNVRRLLSVVSAGELLPNLQSEWADPFKAGFSNNLIDLFLELIRQPDLDILQQERINMANSILMHDTLNEEALKLKCQLLVKTGKNGLAKNVYAAFTKAYFASFGTPFKYTFEQILT